jgi:membrane-associated phospholipid phosphatase
MEPNTARTGEHGSEGPGLVLRRAPTSTGPLGLLLLALAGLSFIGTAVGLPLHAASPLPTELALLERIADGRSEPATALLRSASALGGLAPSLVLALVVAGAARLRTGRWDGPALIALVLVGSLLVTSLVKVVVGRARPTEALVDAWSASFPSGHSSRAAALIGLAIWAVVRLLSHPAVRVGGAVLLGTAMAAVAYSRVYLGIHWPSDVLFGLALGVAWLLAVLWVTKPMVSPAAAARQRGRPPRG